MSNKITQATVEWPTQGTPFSPEFDDVYFSSCNGIEETTYVFLAQNNLPDRWLALKSNEQFVIAETGFGTGLNFLVVANLWSDLKLRGAIAQTAELHFISAEKYPLKRDDMTKVWESWPQFQNIINPLSENYPIPSPGYHRCRINKDINLTLIYRDAGDAFSELEAQVDCWFLDGFTPSKNPDMWTERLFKSMANLSHSSTTYATFTASRFVLDGLQSAGFTAEKTSGYGLKRNMTKGQYVTHGPLQPATKEPWFHHQVSSSPKDTTRPIAVIGAGIAGCSSAEALIRQGYRVDIIEQQDYSAGPPPFSIQGVLYVKLSAELSAHSEFYSLGYLHSLKKLRNISGLEWQQTGVIQTAFNDKELKRQQKFLQNTPYPESLIREVTAEEATEISGVPIDSPGLYFPSGAWVNPISLCQHLMQGANLIHNTKVAAMYSKADQWFLKTECGKTLGPYQSVIVASSNTAAEFEQFKDQLPVKPIRGQKSFIKMKQDNFPLKAVLCGKAYITPAINQQINFGATFNLGETTTEVREIDHQTNKDNILRYVPSLNEWLDQPVSMGIVGFRCTSPDYMPLVGPVPDWQAYSSVYADIHRFKKQVYPPAPVIKGLYCNIGHGSRGLSSVMLSAELLACQISGAPLPLSRSVINHLSPARFLVKKLKKGKV